MPMPSRGYRQNAARYELVELRDNVFVVAIQLFDSRNGQPVRTLPNHVRFFARIIERDGCVYVDRGDFDALTPFDSVADARQYIDMLFELDND